MAKKKSRNWGNGNYNDDNRYNPSAGVKCNSCSKSGHIARDCRVNVTDNNNRSRLRIGRWCAHCKEDNHNTDKCKFRNQDSGGNTKGKRYNEGMRCDRCQSTNHANLDCTHRGQSSPDHYSSSKPPSWPCIYCGSMHYNSSCPKIASNQIQYQTNPQHVQWNHTIPNSTEDADTPLNPVETFANMPCDQCTQRGQPAFQCLYTMQQHINAVQRQPDLNFQSHFQQRYTPVQVAQPSFQQTIYRNPLVNYADSDHGLAGSIRLNGNVLPSGFNWKVDDGRHPFVSVLLDRDGDLVMENTAYWAASAREGSEAHGGDKA